MKKKRNIPKAHHYVPQTYLRKFAEQKGKAFYVHFLKHDEQDESKIHRTNTKNICQKKHLYKLNTDSIDPLVIEKFFSKNIEANYNEVFSILTSNSLKFLTPEYKTKIIEYVVIQLYRSPKWKDGYTNHMKRCLSASYKLCKQKNQDSFYLEGKKILLEGKTLGELQKEWCINSKNEILFAQLKVASDLISLRLKTDNAVITVIEDDKEFVTSDNPVVYHSSDPISMPFDPRNILEMPLSPKHLLRLFPNSYSQGHDLILREKCSEDKADIARLNSNHMQLCSSENFLIGTKTGLQQYLKAEEVKRYLTEEEYNGISSDEEFLKVLKSKGSIS